ncbi:MAG: acyl carrier protein [Acidobacteriota bacterium]|jgi:hypothetical protein
MDAAYEGLWRQLPSSNIYKQEKLIGWEAGGPNGSPADGWVGGDGWAEPGERPGDLLRAGGRDPDAALLGAYHLVLQWYLDDVESLIGCCLVDPRPAPAGGGRKARLLPSYVYAEDEDSVDTLLEEVEGQLRMDGCLEVEPAGPPCRGSRPAPAFFYLGGDGGSGAGDWSPEVLDAGFPGRGVVVCGHEREGGEVWMRSSVAETLGLDGFARRYGEALAALVSGERSLVGEIRELLGDEEEAPSKRLEEMERRVIALWAGVLSLDEAGLDERSSYFELGGTSLNAFKLVNRVRVELHRDISIRDIVENPTVRQFARLLC